MEESKLRKLLESMSLREKVGQLVQLPPRFGDDGIMTGPAAQSGMTPEDLRLIGSCLSLVDAAKIKALQVEFMENHPHHIPLLFMADIIHGCRTAFPVPLAQGCTFDPELVEACAETAAREAAASGVHVTFSPMADLARDARWGRVVESTGEDPYLNACMAAAMVRGYQGKDFRERGRVASCLKHFAAYGAAESGRDYNTVELSMRTLLDDQLPAYRAAVDAGCALVMTSFNTLDRIPSAANRWLIRELLRKQMGFDGTVISDWNAVEELLAHGIAADHAEAAEKAIRAGLDIDMASPCYAKNLEQLVLDGKVPAELVDEACWRVLKLKNDLGLFENPLKDLSVEDEAALQVCEAHRLLAREAAERSFVLLKNEDGALPLSKNEKTAFIGPFLECRSMIGPWALFSREEDTVTILDALKQYDAVFETAPGCPMLDPGVSLPAFTGPVLSDDLDAEKALKEAVDLARRADRVVLTLGEHRDYSGEAASRGVICLPESHLALLREVSKVNGNTVVVLFCGRPLDLREVSKYAKAVLVVWHPGTEGGPAILRTLYGESTPSGKLAMCFPYALGQLPIYYNALSTGRPVRGGSGPARFGSRYLDQPNDPLYPFGFGLSYTDFELSGLTLDTRELAPDGQLRASATLTNTGSRPGTETVQLYLRDVAASVARPVMELKGFRKVTLAPGESREVSFTVSEPMLRFHDVDMRFRSEPGEFELMIGRDSAHTLSAAFTLTE